MSGLEAVAVDNATPHATNQFYDSGLEAVPQEPYKESGYPNNATSPPQNGAATDAYESGHPYPRGYTPVAGATPGSHGIEPSASVAKDSGRRICGLKRWIFFTLFLAALIIVTVVVVGGVIGSKIIMGNSNNSNNYGIAPTR